MIVREINPDDAVKLIELGKQFHKESPFHSRYKFDVNKSVNFMKSLALSSDCCFYVATDKNNKILGIVGGQMLSLYYTEDKYASELIFYVSPESRGGRTALSLLRKFESWAKDNGAKDVELGVVTGINAKKADSFFKKAGYNYLGANFYREIL